MYLDTKDNKWILVVDDEPEARTSLVELIKLQFGDKVRIVEAKDGVEATSKINYQKFDCIITDLFMPRKEGEPFIHSVRSNPLNDATPVIIISGSPQLQKVKNDFEFVDAIEKPFKMNTVVDLLSNHLKVGNNKKRVSANVLNNIVLSIEKFVVDCEKGKVAQVGQLQVKEKGRDVEHDFVSSIQVKIGSVTNTFSILANEEEIKPLFEKQIARQGLQAPFLIESMSFIILKYVIEKASLQKSSPIQASFVQKDRKLLKDKKGLMIGLGNDHVKLDIFATCE